MKLVKEKIKSIFSISLYNNAFYLMLNTVVVSALGFLFWKIITYYFSHSEVGIGTVLLSAAGLIVSITSLDLGVGLVRYIPEVGDDYARLINTVFTLTILLSGVGAVVYLVAIPWIAPSLSFIRTSSLLLIIFLLFTIINAIFNMIDMSLIAVRASKFVFLKSVLNSILKIPLPLIFLWMGGFGIYAGTGVAMGISLLVAWFIFMPLNISKYRPYPCLSRELISRIWSFSISNYMASLLLVFPSYLFPLIILNVLGPEQSAYYYMTWMFASILNIIPSGFTQSLFAEGSNDPGRLTSNGRMALTTSLLLSFIAIIVMLVLGKWLLNLFGTAYAENGIGIFRFLVISTLPGCLNNFFLTINQVKKRVGLIILQSGLTSVVILGLGYWLLKRDGLDGLGLANLITQGTLALFLIWPLWNELKYKVSCTDRLQESL